MARASGSPPTIAVIGAGITGAFAAYFLVRRGSRVVLVERGDVGGQASGRNAGGLNPLHGPGIPGPMLELALTSLDLHRGFWADCPDAAGAPVERLHPFSEDAECRDLEQLAKLHGETPGFSCRWLYADDARTRVPGLSPEVLGALSTAGSFRVEPERYTRAVVDAAMDDQVCLLQENVTALRTAGDHVTAVVTEHSEIRCDAVVAAPGAMSGQLVRWLGVDLAIVPLKGQLLRVAWDAAMPRVEVAWSLNGIYPTAAGDAWVGGTEERVGLDVDPTEAARSQILTALRQLVPGTGEIRVSAQVAGLRPMSADGLPVVGMVPGYANVVFAGGAGRKGMLYGAALGRAASDLAVLGSTELPVDACRLDRPGIVS